MPDLIIDESNEALHQGGFVGTGGFYIRPFSLKAGASWPTHAHYIPHAGNLVSGQARVHWEDPSGETGVIEMRVPCKIHMPAERTHRIEAITDVRWECWFSQSEADGIYGDATQVDWTLEKPHV